MIRSTKSPRVVGYVTSSEPDAKPYELAILTLWLTILFVPPFPGITILRYLIVFYFLSFIVLDAGRVFSAIKRSWIVLPLPILGVFSMFWSPYPTEALRTALLFLTSPVIVIIMATRFSPREIINCLVIASIIGTLYAALFLGTANTGGPYASKNFLAFHMLVAVIACVAIALDKRTSIFLVPPLLVVVGIASIVIVASQAITSLLLMIGSILMLVAIRFMFIGLKSIDGARTFIFIFAGISVAVIGLILTNYLDPKALDNFLAIFGKDSSLTGRTDLWNAAEKVIAEHPVFGVGLEGFWQYNVGAAQTLAENDFKKPGTKLGFHNAYLEVAVHLGLVGLVFFVCSVVWGAVVGLVGFLRNSDMISATFFVIIIVSLVSSMTESQLWGLFNIPASMFFAAGTLYSISRKPRIIGAVVSTPVPSPQT